MPVTMALCALFILCVPEDPKCIAWESLYHVFGWCSSNESLEELLLDVLVGLAVRET